MKKNKHSAFKSTFLCLVNSTKIKITQSLEVFKFSTKNKNKSIAFFIAAGN